MATAFSQRVVSDRKHRLQNVISLFLSLSFVIMLGTSCRLHSPLQEELAKDVQGRYKMVTPSGLQALEILDSDLDKLIESERADFDIYKETSENELINITWDGFIGKVDGLQKIFGKEKRDKVTSAIAAEQKAIKDLDARIKELNDVLSKLNEALTKAEEKRSLAEQLEESKKIINNAFTALDNIVKADPKSPLAQRLSNSVGEIDKFMGTLANNKDGGNRVFSLVVEALRMGRDVTALEKEAVAQEQSYHERVLALYQTEQKIMPTEIELKNMRRKFDIAPYVNYPKVELVRDRITSLANQASREEVDAAREEQQSSDEEELAVQVGRQSGQQEQQDRRIPRKQERTQALQGVEALRRKGQNHRSESRRLQLRASEHRRGAEAQRETMRSILQDLATLQTLTLTNDRRVKELELRTEVEKYRNAKLKDVIYERQRMTLISYGLDGVVRYAEGGLRAEDIANLINVARMVAEIVIAARV